MGDHFDQSIGKACTKAFIERDIQLQWLSFDELEENFVNLVAEQTAPGT